MESGANPERARRRKEMNKAQAGLPQQTLNAIGICREGSLMLSKPEYLPQTDRFLGADDAVWLLISKKYGQCPKNEKEISMKKTNIFKSLFSLMLVLTIVAAMIFAFASCGNTEKSGNDTASTGTETERAEITITVQVKGSDGNVTDFVITTKAEFLRGALEEENLIEGDESEYGLYVKVVNGERADYEADGAYWSFLKNGEYLMSGVDTTPIADGDVFSIEYTKG